MQSFAAAEYAGNVASIKLALKLKWMAGKIASRRELLA